MLTRNLPISILLRLISVNLYTNGNGGRAGQKLDDVHADIYKKVYNRVLEIFKHEGDIPGDLKRNILVRVSR